MCYLGFPAAGLAPAPPQHHQTAEAAKQEQQRPGLPYDDVFMMMCFKVVECDNPEHTREDFDRCPYAHVGEVVTRRPPHTHLPKLCPKARRACRKGRACPYAHNVFEHWLHPSRFKTEICEHGESCQRSMCFFAHRPDEVRHPSPSADEVMAAAEAAGLLNKPHMLSAGGSSGSSTTGCGSSRCTGSCYDSGSACSRRSSATNHDLGASFAAAGAAPWLAPAPVAALAAALQQQQAAQRQLFGQLNAADLTFAAQCLQAQQRVQTAAAAAAAAAAATSTASAGWPAANATADWSLLSGGAPTNGVATTQALLAPSGPLAFSTPSPPLPPTHQPPAAAAGGFNLWSGTRHAVAGPPGLAGLGAAALGASSAAAPVGGLTADEALLLLASSNNAASANYLCALQAQQAAAGLF